MYREAEKQLKSALKQQDMVDTYLYLCKVYVKLDQPLTAIEIFSQGLEKFPGETALISGIARIYEVSKACIPEFFKWLNLSKFPSSGIHPFGQVHTCIDFV